MKPCINCRNTIFFLLDDMTNNNTIRELKLHSPAGVEPAVFTWPNIEQQVHYLNIL
jgi:hypothetical protein